MKIGLALTENLMLLILLFCLFLCHTDFDCCLRELKVEAEADKVQQKRRATEL